MGYLVQLFQWDLARVVFNTGGVHPQKAVIFKQVPLQVGCPAKVVFNLLYVKNKKRGWVGQQVTVQIAGLSRLQACGVYLDHFRWCWLVQLAQQLALYRYNRYCIYPHVTSLWWSTGSMFFIVTHTQNYPMICPWPKLWMEVIFLSQNDNNLEQLCQSNWTPWQRLSRSISKFFFFCMLLHMEVVHMFFSRRIA